MLTLRERLKTEREAQGLTQVELAAKARIAQSFIGAIESKGQENSKYLPEIARALGVDCYWLKTGFGSKFGALGPLNDAEKTILEGYRLMGEESQNDWLDIAAKKIAQAQLSKNGTT